MSRNEYIASILFVFLYFILFGLFSNLILGMGMPSWWYQTLGGNTVSWIKLGHYFGLIAAAIPVALLVVLVFKSSSFRVSWVIAILASLGALIAVLYGFWVMRDVREVLGLFWIAISVLDVLMAGGLFLSAAFFVHKAVPSNKRL